MGVKGEEIKSQEKFHDTVELFQRAVKKAIGDRSSGAVGDPFGGIFLYAYVPLQA